MFLRQLYSGMLNLNLITNFIYFCLFINHISLTSITSFNGKWFLPRQFRGTLVLWKEQKRNYLEKSLRHLLYLTRQDNFI